jgi:hypothetical protein
LDASPIIAFCSEIGKPELLCQLKDYGNTVYVPINVYNEIRNPSFPFLRNAVDNKEIFICEPVPLSKVKPLKDRYPTLKNGELEVITWGLDFKSASKDYVCVIDDKVARKVATKKEVSLTGTKGLLNEMNNVGIIDFETRENLLETLQTRNTRM